MGENILSVSGLSVNFDGHVILKDLTFEIKRDSVWAVIGPNGAGKTVLFKSLLRLIPFNGEIKWHTDARIGYVPQKLFIGRDFPLTVMEFLKLKQSDESQINRV